VTLRLDCKPHLPGTLLGKRPPEITSANRRLNRYILFAVVGMFLYGIILPKTWQSLFGPIAWPIAWVAHIAPAIMKMTKLSPIPELVQGFFGSAAWVSTLVTAMLVRNEPLAARVRYAFSRPGVPFLKTFCFLYFLSLPGLLIGLWVVLFLPISIDMTGGTTWGMKLFVAMISDRFSMALVGGVATGGVVGFLWIVIVLLAGPISLILAKD